MTPLKTFTTPFPSYIYPQRQPFQQVLDLRALERGFDVGREPLLTRRNIIAQSQGTNSVHMAFQPGNKDQRRAKQGFDALMLELKAVPDENPKSLRGLLRKLIDMAAGGDIQALKEILNRVDGLPVQVVENLNENVNYVALMPQRVENMDAWLKQYDTPTKEITKQ